MRVTKVLLATWILRPATVCPASHEPMRVVQDDVDIFDNDSFDSDMERQVSPLQ